MVRRQPNVYTVTILLAAVTEIADFPGVPSNAYDWGPLKGRKPTENAYFHGFLMFFKFFNFQFSLFFDDFWGLKLTIFQKMTKMLSLRGGLDQILFLKFWKNCDNPFPNTLG